jgi:hAT family C-terminal dimerisation region
METAIKELSKNSASLITAEGVYKFLFKKFDEMGTKMSKKMAQIIKVRMNERRNVKLITLLMYLHTGSVSVSDKNFQYTTKNAAISFGQEKSKKFHSTGTASLNSSQECLDLEGDEHSRDDLQQQLKDAINSITNKTKAKDNSDFKKLDGLGKRSEKLNVLYNALLTIKPTSTATERVFSTAGIIKTKLRTRLNTKTFNALLCLKYTFLKEK